MVVVGVGGLHDVHEVLLCEAALVDGMFPEDSLVVLPELHLTPALGEHTIHVHLHLSAVDAVLIVVYSDAHVVAVKVEWLFVGLLGGLGLG